MCSLGERNRQKEFRGKGSSNALVRFLQLVDHDVFEDDPSALLNVAEALLTHLEQSANVFTKRTYGTHSVQLLALHHIFLLVDVVAPCELQPKQAGGPYQRFMELVQGILGRQTYFPLRYQAKLIEQSLVRLVKDQPAVLSDSFRRLMQGMYGCAHVLHGVRKIADADVDVLAFEKGLKALRKACKSGPGRKSWYDRLAELGHVGQLADQAADQVELFGACLAKMTDDQQSLCKGKDLKLLRFGQLQQLRLLALTADNQSMRAFAAEELMDIGTRGVFYRDWGSDRDILESLVKVSDESQS